MTIRVQLDDDILQEIIRSDRPEPKQGQDRSDYDRQCALREYQVYRLLRSVVSQFNGRMKGRRERFKLIEEGDGLIIELSE